MLQRLRSTFGGRSIRSVADTIILIIVIVTAVSFDFTNGFHDTANAMATSIATRALKPKIAVGISAILNLVGAFLSVAVATTIGKGIVNLDKFDLHSGDQSSNLLLVVFAGLIGAILWNLLTWLLGIPSSSSLALFGGLVGSAFASLGTSGVQWENIVEKIIIPAVASPFVAGAVSALSTFLIYKLTAGVNEQKMNKHFRRGQIATASLVSLAHGTGDAQKTMGVVFMALVAAGELFSDARMPAWVIFMCASAIALGTYSGGWRVIRTLGKGLVEIESPQGMAAEAASAAIILTSSHAGMALSTTQVATGSIMGTGVGRKGAEVRWGVAGRMAIGWILTLPAAGIVGMLTWFLAHEVAKYSNTITGVLVDLFILVVLSAMIYIRSLRRRVTSQNVNDDWQDDELKVGKADDEPPSDSTTPAPVPSGKA